MGGGRKLTTLLTTNSKEGSVIMFNNMKVFYIHGTMHRESNLITVQTDANVFSLLYRVILSLEAPNYCLMQNTGKCKSLDESNISRGGSMLFYIVAGMCIKIFKSLSQ